MELSDLPGELVERGIWWQIGGFAAVSAVSVALLVEFEGSGTRAYRYFEAAVRVMYWANVFVLFGLFEGVRKVFEKTSDIRRKYAERRAQERERAEREADRKAEARGEARGEARLGSAPEGGRPCPASASRSTVSGCSPTRRRFGSSSATRTSRAECSRKRQTSGGNTRNGGPRSGNGPSARLTARPRRAARLVVKRVARRGSAPEGGRPCPASASMSTVSGCSPIRRRFGSSSASEVETGTQPMYSARPFRSRSYPRGGVSRLTRRSAGRLLGVTTSRGWGCVSSSRPMRRRNCSTPFSSMPS